MRSPTRQTSRNVFNVFGFPTTVKPGFGVFLAFLIFLYPYPLGLWMAGAVGIFTLIHELGHALAARMSGCTASISLDFMVAYAAYEPRSPLTWGQKARIALAGPSLQIVCAVTVLLLNSTNPFSRADITISDATISIWWAGIALGAMNLIPLLPLTYCTCICCMHRRRHDRPCSSFCIHAVHAISSHCSTTTPKKVSV